MSKSKDVGGRPVVKAEFQEGRTAAKNFVEDMRTALTVSKKQLRRTEKAQR